REHGARSREQRIEVGAHWSVGLVVSYSSKGSEREGNLFGDDVGMQNRLITDSFVERFKNDATGVRLRFKPGARRSLCRVGPLNVAGFLKPRFQIRFIGKNYLPVLP